MEEIGLSFLIGLSFAIPQLIILSACVYYLIKRVTLEGILLGLGSFGGLIVIFVNMILVPYLIRKNGVSVVSGNINIMTISGVISFFASLAFAVGFFILVYKAVKRKQYLPGIV